MRELKEGERVRLIGSLDEQTGMEREGVIADVLTGQLKGCYNVRLMRGTTFASRGDLAPVEWEFAFDVKLFATIRVMAKSQEEAEALIREHVDAASANLGAWPNGDPILAEVSVDGALDLIEIDGEEPE